MKVTLGLFTTKGLDTETMGKLFKPANKDLLNKLEYIPITFEYLRPMVVGIDQKMMCILFRSLNLFIWNLTTI